MILLNLFKMHSLDFLSGPPKFFIFQKESNKTNFGGVFFFIYIFIVILISIFYVYSCSQADKFTFSSNDIEEHAIFEDEVNKREKSSDFNPAYDFSFDLENYTDHNISSDFIIYDEIQQVWLERNKWYKRNVHDNQLLIFYNCNPKNCSSITEDDLFPTFLNYYLTISYKGPVLDHYSKYPISNVVDKFNNNNSDIVNKYSFSFNTPSYYNLVWKRILYNDQVGILDKLFDKKKKNQYIGGKFELYNKEIINKFFNPYTFYDKLYNLKLLCRIYIHSNVEKTTNYSRKEKSIVDAIANICSLSLTILNAINIIFSNIYSKNFDSFKIIQKILDNNSMENPSHIELNSFFKEKDSLMPLSNDDIIFKSKAKNTSTSYGESLKLDLIQNKEMENSDNLDENSIKMPKLRLSDYLLNNVYSFKNWKSIKQEVITVCKEILLKYCSIDRLLYNQIKLENLFLDYKWNDPKLKYIKNNKDLDKLKILLNELIII